MQGDLYFETESLKGLLQASPKRLLLLYGGLRPDSNSKTINKKIQNRERELADDDNVGAYSDGWILYILATSEQFPA